jgi:hypothetical protein
MAMRARAIMSASFWRDSIASLLVASRY